MSGFFAYMNMKKIIASFIALDEYIQRQETGSPQQLAIRLRISIRTVHSYIRLFKDLGAPIKYSRTQKTYFYSSEGGISFRFASRRLTKAK